MKACLLVGIALAIIPIGGHVASALAGAQLLSQAFSPEGGETLDGASASGDAEGGGGGYGMLGSIEAPAEVASAFSEEVIALAELDDVRANEDCSVVGFAVDGGAEEALSWLSGGFEQRGWMPVESGSASMRSFVKGSGSYTWLLAYCISFEDETSVVLYAH